ncbi:thioredoxin-dependent thiol peroxidase [Patescibacteria group bacterium]
MKLQIGDKAPVFSLSDQKGEKHDLKQYQGRWLLLYFYPRDNTPGCTKEACSIRDNYSQYKKNEIAVLGVSTDNAESHEKFATKHELPFTLLADPKKEVVKIYGVYGRKHSFGKSYFGTNRVSFLIDPQGKIAKIYEDVKPTEHAEEVLRDIATLKNK